MLVETEDTFVDKIKIIKSFYFILAIKTTLQ